MSGGGAAPVRFVLVRPRNPLNIGAAARAIANFGFRDLCVVDPYEPVWREARAAVGAEPVLAAAEALPLDRALEDAHVVLGTHDGRRRGGPPRLELPQLREWLASHGGRVAVLFGPEKTGLGNVELERCHAAVRIPTSPSCPSMNLAQAVAVVAYELAREQRPARPAAAVPAMTDGQREAFVKQAVALARQVGWRSSDPDAVVARKFRELLLRRPLARDESATLQALMRRLLTAAA